MFIWSVHLSPRGQNSAVQAVPDCAGARHRTGYRSECLREHSVLIRAATVQPEHCVTMWLLSKTCPPLRSPPLFLSVISIQCSMWLKLACWASHRSVVLSVKKTMDRTFSTLVMRGRAWTKRNSVRLITGNTEYRQERLATLQKYTKGETNQNE